MHRRFAPALGLIVSIAAAGLVAACTATTGGTGAFDPGPTITDGTKSPTPTSTRTSGNSTSPNPTTSGRSKSPDFPSPTNGTPTPTSATPTPSTSTTGDDAALQAQLADIGTRWMHAYASDDVQTFCTLSDAATLQALLAANSIDSCDTLDITWSDTTVQAQLQSWTIPDPTNIIVLIDTAILFPSDASPANLRGMAWDQQADGSWKVDVSGLSGD
jgi:hypothetical protein